MLFILNVGKSTYLEKAKHRNGIYSTSLSELRTVQIF